MSPFPVRIGAKTEMVPALDVMLLRIRTRALAGDQKVIRSLIEHFGSGALTTQLVRCSGDPEVIRLAKLERAPGKSKWSSGRGGGDAYAEYHNNDRTHLALGKECPKSRAIDTDGEIASHLILSGLRHRDGRKTPKR